MKTSLDDQFIGQCYEESDQFMKDMTFFKKDMIFLEHLLDRYFRKMVSIKNLDEVRESVIRFQNLNYSHDKLFNSLKIHRSKLRSTKDERSKESVDDLMNGQLNLLTWIVQFSADYKKIRREILSITNEVLEAKKEPGIEIETMNLFSQN